MTVTTNLDLMHGGPTAFIDVQGEIDFWRRAYRDHPAFSPRRHFTDYEPALRIGIHRIHWDEAGCAAAAAWHRLVRCHQNSAAAAVRAAPGMPLETAIAS